MSDLVSASDYVWLWRGQAAIVLGTVAFVVLLVPIVVWQYRTYGSLNLRRLIGSGAASLYLAALVSYTVLPLPDPAEVVCKSPSLEPMHFVEDLNSVDPGTGVMGVLMTRTALQILLNVALFIPWGIFVRGLLGRSFMTATNTGALVSVLIEVTQGTRMWHAYLCPYRVADIDDVLMNATGALIGALIAPLVLWWMPRPRDLARTRLVPRHVTVWRRWLAMIVECGALVVTMLVPLLVARTAAYALHVDVTVPQWRVMGMACAVLAWLVVFAVPALRGHGSLGMKAVWLAPVWQAKARALHLRRLARASVISGPWLLAMLASTSGGAAVISMLVVAAIISVPCTADSRGLSCLLTGARLIDSRAVERPDYAPDLVRAA